MTTYYIPNSSIRKHKRTRCAQMHMSVPTGLTYIIFNEISIQHHFCECKQRAWETDYPFMGLTYTTTFPWNPTVIFYYYYYFFYLITPLCQYYFSLWKKYKGNSKSKSWEWLYRRLLTRYLYMKLNYANFNENIQRLFTSFGKMKLV